jgi:hypothetical protein
METSTELLFEVMTPLGFSVHTTPAYWEMITKVKHPNMAGRLDDVKETLEKPDEIRVSKRVLNVYLFYKAKETRR